MGSKLILLCLFSIGFSSGCTKISVGYKYADIILMKTADKSFDLDFYQAEHLEKDIKNYLGWHKTIMLPKYESFLRDVAADLGAQVTLDRKTYFNKFDHIKRLTKETVEPSLEPVSHVIASLQKDQIDHFSKALNRKSKKLEKKYLVSSSKRYENSRERIIDFWDDWVIPLDKEQKKLVSQHVPLIALDAKPWLKNRKKNQAELLKKINNKETQKKIKEYLSTWLFHPEKLRTKKVQKHIEKIKQASNEMVYKILASVSPKQRQALSKRFIEYADEFNKLSQ